MTEWSTGIEPQGLVSRASFVLWKLARDRMRLEGFRQIASYQTTDGWEEQYQLECVCRDTVAVATLKRSMPFGEVQGEVTYFDRKTGAALRDAIGPIPGSPLEILEIGILDR